MATRANPMFSVGALVVPFGALAGVLLFGTNQQLTFVHVMAGVLWTGIDLFMALVLGPVLGGLAVEERASVFQRFTPKMTFLMPALAFTTIFGGITLASRLGWFETADPWIALFSTVSMVPALLAIGWQFDAFRDWRWWAAFALVGGGSAVYLLLNLGGFAPIDPAVQVALVIVTLLTFVGFGVLMPGEARMYLEMTSDDPDPNVIGAIGLRNAKLSGVQGVLQLGIIVVMVYLRWGGF
ncbi:hypothetical protein ACFPYI_18675 [Halomarina salina]|uniref:Uncharacterized protein n=1 Tax=Halomarina salina TaxID=1872699 RepID=A0ABD5RT91_9EURY